ncbi:MAG: hypothetical protein HC831_27505 [Chloroflexia bacterium]|nr:hypothetical protein [Chloroflexia bacterium]
MNAGVFATGWQALDLDGADANGGSWFFPAKTWVVTDNEWGIVRSGDYCAGSNTWLVGGVVSNDWLITSG